MTNIIRLPSGFFAIRSESGEIRAASVTRWDGRTGTAYPYNTAGIGFEYYRTARGDIWYTDEGGKNARIWCSAERLAQHCHRLHQIAARGGGTA